MNRRRLFGLIPAVLAAAVLPVSAETLRPEKKSPAMLERTCDGGWESPVARAKAEAECGHRLPGCGTVFQWYIGMQCMCPNCGYHYSYLLQDVKSGRFTPKE